MKKILLILLSVFLLSGCDLGGTQVIDKSTQDVQLDLNPVNRLPVDEGGRLYYNDIDLRYSNLYNFISTNNSFNNGFEALTVDLWEGVIDSTSNTEKQIKIYFLDTLTLNGIELGCNIAGKSFSNIKVEILGSGVPSPTRLAADTTNDNTKYTSRAFDFEVEVGNGIILTFDTVDEVCLTNLNFRKVRVYEQANTVPNLDIARGNVVGVRPIHKFGNNPSLSLGVTEDIWEGGGHYTGQDPTTAETLEIFSNDNDDQPGDTGAYNITVSGLDINWNEISETLDLSGTTSVYTTQEFIRMNRAFIHKVGSSGFNEGSITIRQSLTTINVMSILPAEYGQTMIGAYSVPAGKTAYMNDWFATLSKKTGASCTIRILMREFGEGFKVKEQIAVQSQGTAYAQRSYQIPKNDLHEKADVKVDANCDSNNVGVAAGFDIVLDDN